MDRRKRSFITIVLGCLLMVLLQTSCSNKKNTAFSRFYHSVNTRYNVHFNANEAYKESLSSKEKSEEEQDNLSKMLYIYPEIKDSTDLKYKGSFTTTIDKTTKAIKLHSIKTRPQRDPSKQRDEKYQQWVRQKEFNPFLVNSWMLLAKSEFHEGNYLRAITTFMYITKIYESDKRIVSESKLWIARSYSEMGWKYEAENVLRKMEQNDEIHHQLLGMYSGIKANLYMRNNSYESAIPFLDEAIKQEKRKNVKRRNKYLLGQLYVKVGENKKAYDAFGSVRGFSTPHVYALNSKLRQLEVSGQTDAKVISSLKGMAKSSKNKEYLDQVYTALGNVYLNSQDTANAIKNYHLAIEKSTKTGYDKALAQIKVGALYFNQQEYVKAQPCYSGALPQLRKDDEYYPIVSLRSEVLDQLVVHAKVVQEQDSLLLLASMPEEQRLEVIHKHIDELKKEEERKKKEEQRLQAGERQEEQQVTGWGDLGGGWGGATAATPTTQIPSGGQETSDFYFYNEQTVAQGKITFQKQWGRRALEDNWRRQNKSSGSLFGDSDLLTNIEEEENAEGEEKPIEEGAPSSTTETATDIYSVEYYLQQLPLTDEAKEESRKLVENGLFNMGLIYKNLLLDNTLAIKTFEEDLSRFPNTPNREEIYYQLFLIYLQMGNREMMASYRNHIINEYPTGKYTIPLLDENYAWNFTYMSKVQEELYQESYEAYLAGNVQKVRTNYEEIQTKFPFVDLMPKFAFLNSLTYAQTKDAPNLEKTLTKLIADYPQADVTPLATNILKNIKDGKILLSDGTAIRSMDWTMAYASDSLLQGDETKVIEYVVGVDKPYVLLLMFKPNTIDRNELLYQVADYNFSNYVIQTYDLSFNTDEVISSLEIKGFENFKAIKSYLNKSMLEDGLLTKLEQEIVPVPISVENYVDVFPRLGVEKYMTFYADSLAKETPSLLAYWGKENERLVAMLDDEPETEESVEPKEEEAIEVIIPETSEEIIVSPTQPETKPEKVKEPVENENDKEINLEDILSEEQVKIIGGIDKKTDDIAEGISKLGSNPVEGLKNIFNRDKIEDNLSKEEKEELKQQQKIEKERQKELQKIEKTRVDSIAKVERLRTDSIKQIERAVEDSIQAAQKMERERVESERKERERLVKEAEETRKRELQEREDARKELLKQREDARKQQEKERDIKLRQREKERDELIKTREAERKQKEKEAEEQRKKQEQERKEKLRQREQELKNRRR